MRRLTALISSVLTGLVVGGCSDDGISGPQDRTPPEVTVLDPGDGAFVSTDRPTFRIEVTDLGSGPFCSSIEASINGVNYSQYFRNGCSESSGEVVVLGGSIFPPLEDGGAFLTFTISDHAGNEATRTRGFTVDTEVEPPPT